MKYKFKTLPPLKVSLPLPSPPDSAEELSVEDRQMDNMSPEERAVQRALGLLCDWIILVEDRLKLFRRGTHYYRSKHEMLDRGHLIYVIVEAIDRAHARRQVERSGHFPRDDFSVRGGWQSNRCGAYYRKQYREHDEFPYRKRPTEERVYVL